MAETMKTGMRVLSTAEADDEDSFLSDAAPAPVSDMIADSRLVLSHDASIAVDK